MCLSVTTNSFTEENKELLIIVLVQGTKRTTIRLQRPPGPAGARDNVMAVSEALVHNALSLSVDKY